MNKKVILVSLIAAMLFGLPACSNKKLEQRIAELEAQLDDCLHGPEKLLALMKVSFEKEDFLNVELDFQEFENRHPDAPEFAEAKQIFETAKQIESDRIKEAERKAEQEKQEKLAALNKLKKSYDDVAGVTWYYNPYFTHYNNKSLASIYMGERSGSPWLRLKMSYQGLGWIFFERAFLSYEGNTLEIPFNTYEEKKSDNSGGSVWEWIDVRVTPQIEIFLREFSKSTDAKMRLSGKYTETRSLTQNERRGIVDVLSGYDALREAK